MSSKQTAKTDYDGSTPLKSIMQEMFVGNLLAGMNQTDAYKAAGYKSKNPIVQASQAVTYRNIKARIDYKKAAIEEASKIKVSYCQYKLLDLANKAEQAKKYSTAKSCIDSLLKTIGGFKADEPSDKSIELKLIDAEARLEVARALQGYYDGKYLASSSR